MHEADGTLEREATTYLRHCNKCRNSTQHNEHTWESSCGGYEDYKYTCTVCGAVHWVDGMDS